MQYESVPVSDLDANWPRFRFVGGLVVALPSLRMHSRQATSFWTCMIVVAARFSIQHRIPVPMSTLVALERPGDNAISSTLGIT